MLRPRAPEPDGILQEKWTADFNKPKHVRFEIKSDSSYDANLVKTAAGHCLELGLKKTNAIVWTEAAGYRYRDLVMNGRLCIDSCGGYAAGGMMFRALDEKTYYSFLVSSKGYFRLDAVRNGMPLPLVGWTELPDIASAKLLADHTVEFSVIVCGDRIILLINNNWVADIMDSSISEGNIAFAAASYEANASYETNASYDANASDHTYTARIYLESLTVDSKYSQAAAACEKWKGDNSGTDAVLIDPKCRFRLAETFTALGQYKAAMAQLQKSWEFAGHKKTQKELLLAGRLAQILGLMTEAESYISACFQANVDSPEGKEAVTEMAKILYTGERYADLKNYCIEAVKLKSDDPLLYTFKGHAHWELKEYKEAAAAYDRAFELDSANGLAAKNSGNVFEALGKKKEALNRFLAAGSAFLAAENYNDLGLLVPVFLSLGASNPAAHGLAGKWAFGVEDWKMAGDEFEQARALERKKKTVQDPALAYLQALLLIRKGRRRQAIPLLEEAVSLNPDYALFHFKLAENRYLADNDPEEAELRSELETALALSPGDGWINNFAAQLSLQRGNLNAAAEYLKKAYAALGDEPAIKMNCAALMARQGDPDRALELLDADRVNDEDGSFANCAGNILANAGRFEQADDYYRKAIAREPENAGYLNNRASCLLEMGLYGEADTLLAKIYELAPGPDVLEQISFIASKKGEYKRAESACRSALELDPGHIPSLLSLGWVLANTGRTAEAGKILEKIKTMELTQAQSTRRDELAQNLENLVFTTICCAGCGRSWKVSRETPPVRGIRLFAMPPDELPAGSCAGCGKTWCIGCAKKNLDSDGRFICEECKKPLKLVNEGLKKLIYDWAVSDGLTEKKHVREHARGVVREHARGRPKKLKP